MEKKNNEKVQTLNDNASNEWRNLQMEIKRTWTDYGMHVMYKYNEVEEKKTKAGL
jgi:hypothetical protein